MRVTPFLISIILIMAYTRTVNPFLYNLPYDTALEYEQGIRW